MTNGKRKAIIYGCGFLMLVILFLMLRGRAGDQTTINNHGGLTVNGGGVTNNGSNFGPDFVPDNGGPIVINSPNFGGPRDMSMIGSCCSDCAVARPTFNYAPASNGPTFVTNQASNGPTIFQYFSQLISPPPPAPVMYSLFASR